MSGRGFGVIEGTKHPSSVSPSHHKRSQSRSKSPGAKSDRKSTIGDRVSKLESVVLNLNQTNGQALNQFQSNSFGTLEPVKMAGIMQLKEDLSNFAREVDR